MKPGNLFDLPEGLLNPDDPGDEECFETLSESAGFRVERIVSQGQQTPAGEWYDQPSDEWVVLLQGEAALQWDDGSITHLRAGDWLMLPAGLRHRVHHTSREPACLWLAVHGQKTGP